MRNSDYLPRGSVLELTLDSASTRARTAAQTVRWRIRVAPQTERTNERNRQSTWFVDSTKQSVHIVLASGFGGIEFAVRPQTDSLVGMGRQWTDVSRIPIHFAGALFVRRPCLP